ncbi:hypothetical protein [Sphingomonas colocasiae]|uniref:DUF4167 domain-containing protein n=1 Tax=Sphingomonas colocasiae TaxID=1848973 RepID=A0ABS7PSN2_9SPHN|nr:hypothetical protein [Sphingomonas colocasiae]MBY8823397.1 hypothetical protein [Sphingomonas colocasiae]
MPHESQYDYYLRRERECREAAERSSDPAIRHTHLSFAQKYAGFVEAAGRRVNAT